jgi:hypothetical protein
MAVDQTIMATGERDLDFLSNYWADLLDLSMAKNSMQVIRIIASFVGR